MGRAAANDDDVEALDFQHGREGVASIGVGLVLVVGGEAGAHFDACRCVDGVGDAAGDVAGDAAGGDAPLEMRLVGCVGFVLPTVVLQGFWF